MHHKVIALHFFLGLCSHIPVTHSYKFAVSSNHVLSYTQAWAVAHGLYHFVCAALLYCSLTLLHSFSQPLVKVGFKKGLRDSQAFVQLIYLDAI